MQRGDIYLVDLDPTRSHEQRGHRPVVVLSDAKLNRMGVCLVAPITSGGAAARNGLLTIALAGVGCETSGVVLCHQIRTIDLRARNARFKERLGEDFVRAIILRICDIFSFDGL